MTKRKLRVPHIAASRAARKPRRAQTTYDAAGQPLFRSYYSPHTNLVVINVCDQRVTVSPAAVCRVIFGEFVRHYYRDRPRPPDEDQWNRDYDEWLADDDAPPPRWTGESK